MQVFRNLVYHDNLKHHCASAPVWEETMDCRVEFHGLDDPDMYNTANQLPNRIDQPNTSEFV